MRNHENHQYVNYDGFRHRIAVTDNEAMPIRDLPGLIEIEIDGATEVEEVDAATFDAVMKADDKREGRGRGRLKAWQKQKNLPKLK